MARVPLRLSCVCGHAGTWQVAAGRSWQCPACARSWVPDPTTVRTALAQADRLLRLRRMVLALVLVTLGAAAAVVLVHPGWVLGVPMLLGGVLLASKPTYDRRRRRALAALPRSIPLMSAPVA